MAGRAIAGTAGAVPGEGGAAVGVEEVELAGVDPDLCLFAAADAAGGVEAGDDLLLSLPQVGGAGLVEAVANQVGELVGLDPFGLDVEVGVEVGAERLDEVDVRLEDDAAVLAAVLPPSSPTSEASSKLSGRRPATTGPSLWPCAVSPASTSPIGSFTRRR